MGNESLDIRQTREMSDKRTDAFMQDGNDFVLEKSIFSNIFEKDIRRVFIYKKAERLASAVSLIAPAFAGSASLKNRLDAIAVGLVDAAIHPPGSTRPALARELLALSSVLSMARTTRLLSPMNIDLISREAHHLLTEIASYEEPRLSLAGDQTLASFARHALSAGTSKRTHGAQGETERQTGGPRHARDKKGFDSGRIKDRREAILSVIKDKGRVSIKDISSIIKDISEKTVQRELSSLVELRVVRRQGERRWSTYSLA